MSRQLATLSVFLCSSVIACTGRSGPSVGAEGGTCRPDDLCDDGLSCRDGLCLAPVRREQIIGVRRDAVDVLFVIDNSGSMREEQASLAVNFNRFINLLNEFEGGLPSMHIGVISTDVGAGPFGIMGCTGNGDNGLLQNAPSGACNTPTDAFISDLRNPDGSRNTNFSGDLATVFSCIAELGTAGCGFEQPLESMRRALNGSNSQNSGFLRSEAALAVVLLTDEDDCSVEDVSMFDSDPALDRPDSQLGPLSSFRCFEFGVRCSPDAPRAEGGKQDCVAREDSLFMYKVSDYASFLRGLKTADNPVIFSAIAGVGAVRVGRDGSEPLLEPACVSGNGEANPGVRIADLAGQLGMPAPSTICNEDLSDALTLAAENIFSMMSGRCLATAQPSECTIADVQNYGAGVEQKQIQELPPCDQSAEGPCSTIVLNSPNCPASESMAEVIIDRRSTSAPADTVVVAACPN